jgi:hypothetical protein
MNDEPLHTLVDFPEDILILHLVALDLRRCFWLVKVVEADLMTRILAFKL